jgi:quinolinate synthase
VPIIIAIILLAIISVFIYKYLMNKKIQRTITPTDVNIIDNIQYEIPNVEIVDIRNNNQVITNDLNSKDIDPVIKLTRIIP